LHPRMSARALFRKLQAAAGVKTGAFGTAWVDGMSLMLQLDKPLSGLVKKIRGPVKACGFRITKAVLWNEDGTIFEQDDQTDNGGEGPGASPAQVAAPAPAETGTDVPPAPPEASLTYARKLAELTPRIKEAAAGGGGDADKHQRLLDFAATKAKGKDFLVAIAALSQLEQLLDQPAPTSSAMPKADAGSIDAGVAFKVRLTALILEIKEAQAAGRVGAQEAKLRASEAGVFAGKRDFGRANALLDEAEKALHASGGSTNAPVLDSPGAASDFRQHWQAAVEGWRDASDEVDAQISRLQQALRKSGDGDLHEIADSGLNGITAGAKVGLLVSIRELGGETGKVPAGRIAKARKAVAQFRAQIEQDPRVGACDTNPFGVPVSLRATLLPALDRLDEALGLAPIPSTASFKKVFLNAKETANAEGLLRKDEALADKEALLRSKVGKAELEIRDKQRLIGIKAQATQDPSAIHPDNQRWYLSMLRSEIAELEAEIAALQKRRAQDAQAISAAELSSLEASIAQDQKTLQIKTDALRDPELFSPANRSLLRSVLGGEVKKLESKVELQSGQVRARQRASPELDSVLLRKQLDVVEAGRAEIALYRQILSKRPFLSLDQLDPVARRELISEEGKTPTKDQRSSDRALGFVRTANAMVEGLPPQVQAWLYQSDPKARARDLIEPMLRADDTKLMSLLVHNLAANPPEACRMELRQLVALRLQGPTISNEISGRLGEIRKRAQKLDAMLKNARKAASEAQVPDEWCSKLTGEYKDFLKTLYCDTASEVGLDHYTLLGVGSMARDEMLPYSDIDYQTILDRKVDLYVYRAMEKIKEVEDYCNALLAYIDEPKLDEMERPESVAGFFPEKLAEAHAQKKMDIIQDAIELASVSEIKLSRDTKRLLSEGDKGQMIVIVDEPGGVAEQYFDCIKAIMGDAEARKASILPFIDQEADKFHPEKSPYMYGAKKDVKKGLLRMPIFCVRNLVFYYGLAGAPQDLKGRCDALIKGKFMSDAVAEGIMFVSTFALNLRRKLHAHYKEECEDFCLKADAAKVKPAQVKEGEAVKGEQARKVEVYVLDDNEDADARKCIAINLDLFNRMKRLTQGCFLTFNELGTWVIEKRHPGGTLLDCTAVGPTRPVVAARMRISLNEAVTDLAGQAYAVRPGADAVTRLEIQRQDDPAMVIALVDQDLVNGLLKVGGATIMFNTGDPNHFPFM
jgi:hypothetical protein